MAQKIPRRRNIMSELVVVAYPDQYRAAEVMATLKRLQTEYLIDLDDAVYVTKDAQGKIKLDQSVDLTTRGALGGAFWGSLIGLLFLMPIFGAAVGAAAGAISGHYSDYGIDDNFIKQLSAQMQPNSSAIFVLVRKSTPDKVLPEVSKYGGTVIKTSLPNDMEEKLQAALTAGYQPATAPESVPAPSATPTPNPTPAPSS
jgi:uncharacterized membrane protein